MLADGMLHGAVGGAEALKAAMGRTTGGAIEAYA